MKFGTQLKISSVVVLMSVLLTSLGAGSEVRKAYALCMPQAVAEGCIVRLPPRPSDPPPHRLHDGLTGWWFIS
jgi:hypothetical protein